ncbi:MAG: hypothetical protein ABID54_10345 [Pseudomonadota bacterium]
MKKVYFPIGLLVLVILSVVGCAGGRIYLVNLKYLPEKTTGQAIRRDKPLTVGVQTFEDLRTKKDDVGRRVRLQGQVDVFRSDPVPINEAVTQAVRDYLKSRGYRVVDIQNWDLSPEGLSAIPENIHRVIGGKVEALWTEAESFLTHTKIKSRVKLLVCIGKVEKRKVITREVESTPEMTEILFSPGTVGKSLNETTIQVIERTLDDLS